MDDGAAESAAILIALDAIGSARRGKEILGVEHRIANEFEGVSVETVCARLGDDVNDAASVGAVLRAVVAGLDAEFLERVGERKGLIDVGVFVHVVAAVELVADGILAGSICGESDGPGESLGGTLIGTSIRRVDRSGDKQSQLRGIAAVQRELRNALLFDDLLQDGRRRIHLESIARHRDHFRGHAQLQAHVYGKRLIREQGNPTFLGDAEALRLHAQVVGRRLQGGNHIEPLRISHGVAKKTPTHFCRGDLRARDWGSSGISDPADDTPQALRVQKQRREQKSEKNKWHILFHVCLPFRGRPATFVSTGPAGRGVPGASTTRLRLSHHGLNATENSPGTITLIDSRYQLLE